MSSGSNERVTGNVTAAIALVAAPSTYSSHSWG